MTDFYKTQKWRKLRRRVLEMFGSTCMNCGNLNNNPTDPPHVDHIHPRSKFPKLELDITNMQVLCEYCNCNMKGVTVVDYRTSEHKRIIERYVGGQPYIEAKRREQSLFDQEQKQRRDDRKRARVKGLSKNTKSKKQRLQLCINRLTKIRHGKTEYEYQLNKRNTISALISVHGNDIVTLALESVSHIPTPTWKKIQYKKARPVADNKLKATVVYKKKKIKIKTPQ